MANRNCEVCGETMSKGWNGIVTKFNCRHCEEKCHCGKDGHALNSINCPVHSIKKRMERLIGSKSSDYNKGVQDCINILGF